MNNNTPSSPPPGNLGRGLGALFDEASAARTTIPAFDQGYARIPVKAIDLPDWMGARNRNTDALNALSNSIKEHGILQPLLVRKDEDRYIIISGGRRYAAALRCGLSNVPVIILANKEKADELDLYLAENIQSLELALNKNDPEITALCDHFGITPEDLLVRISTLAPFRKREEPKPVEEPAAAIEETPSAPSEPVQTETRPFTPPPAEEPSKTFPEKQTSDQPQTLYRNLFYATLVVLAVIVITGIITMHNIHPPKAEITENAINGPAPKQEIMPKKGIPAQTVAQENKEPKKPVAPAAPTAVPPQPTRSITPQKMIPTAVAETKRASLPAGLVSQLQIAGTELKQQDNHITIQLDQPAFSYRTQLSDSARAILESIAIAIRPDIKQMIITVYGHTDDDPITTGAYHSNYDLGLQRAAAAAEFLHRNGNLPMNRILIQSEGARNAPYSNKTPATKRKNRTITVEISPISPY